MAAVKSSGLGDNFYIGGYNLSSDVNALGTISGGNAPLEVTGIDKSAFERLGGLRNGTMEFTSFFDDQPLQEHAALSALSTADRQAMYLRGTTLGNQAAAMVCKQVNYDGTRAADGAFTLAVQCQSTPYGLEWGRSLTAGVRTDTGATIGSSIDTAASLSFGGQAYLQVFAFTGTDVTFKIEDSADDSSFSLITGNFESTVVSSAPSAQRFTTALNTTTLRRYIHVKTTTTGGFSSVSFAVVVVKNEIAGQVF